MLTRYNFHTSVPEHYTFDSTKKYRICSIDPAYTDNYAVRIEDRDLQKGTIETIFLDKISVRAEEPLNYYSKLIDELDKIIDKIEMCHYIVIEKQLKSNYKMTRMGQHSISYFMCRLKDKGVKPIIYEIESRAKSKIIGAPAKTKSKELKKLSVDYAFKILEERGDQKGIDLVNSFKKKDDVCDTICQSDAFCQLATDSANLAPIIKVVKRKQAPKREVKQKEKSQPQKQAKKKFTKAIKATKEKKPAKATKVTEEKVEEKKVPKKRGRKPKVASD